jgi:hypothetical protein
MLQSYDIAAYTHYLTYPVFLSCFFFPYKCSMKVDVQASREKVACHIVINKFNEQQVPIARQFIVKHVTTSYASVQLPYKYFLKIIF